MYVIDTKLYLKRSTEHFMFHDSCFANFVTFAFGFIRDDQIRFQIAKVTEEYH